MGWKGESSVLSSHDRAPSTAELEAFNLIHTVGRNIVLLPVIVNGERRFALALVQQEASGMSSMIIGYLATPEDELMRADGTTSRPMKSDIEKKDIKHLH